MSMRDVILQQHEQLTTAINDNSDVQVEGEFDSVVLVGMGGSGHPGDLLNALGIMKLPLTVHRSYGLPPLLGTAPLIIISSYSGNTEEALDAYTQARKAGHPVLVNTSGGTLLDWAKRDDVPYCLISFTGMQPRHTLLASFTGLAVALANSGIAEDSQPALQAAAAWLAETIPTMESAAEQLAESLIGKVPLIYAAEQLAFAAQNFKIQFNENAKYPAFWNFFPELNHNEMVGFSKRSDYPLKVEWQVLMLRDIEDDPRNQTRMDVTKGLYEEWGLAVTDVPVKGTNQIQKIFCAVSFGLWVTYFVATKNNIDPVPVDGVEDFKAKLAEVAGQLPELR